MSKNEFDFKAEEVDIYIEQQETEGNYIENKAIIDFLFQHEPRKDIDISKIKIPSYLDLNDEGKEEN